MLGRTLKKYCIKGFDDIKLYDASCGHKVRYIVRHAESDDLWIFDSLADAVMFIRREFVHGEVYVYECS
jgi:hypothetical protein